jgi:hypothetical protein
MFIACHNVAMYGIAGMFIKYSIKAVTGLLQLPRIHCHLNRHKILNFIYTSSNIQVEFQKFISTLYRSWAIVSHEHDVNDGRIQSQLTLACIMHYKAMLL